MIRCGWRYDSDYACTDPAEIIEHGAALCLAHAMNRGHDRDRRFKAEMEATKWAYEQNKARIERMYPVPERHK